MFDLFPTPICIAARQAARNEAACLGIRVEAVGEGLESSVCVVNLPRSDALCVLDAASEADTVTQVVMETMA